MESCAGARERSCAVPSVLRGPHNHCCVSETQPYIQLWPHNHCVRSQHFTTHGTAQAIHTPAQLLLCSTAIPPGSVRPHYQMFARVAKLRVSQNLRGHHLDGQLSEGADLSSAVLSAFSGPLTYTWWLSSWHFLGGVCVLFDARLRLLGRML